MTLLGHLLVAALLGLVLVLAFVVLIRTRRDRPGDGEVWDEMWTAKGRRWLP